MIWIQLRALVHKEFEQTFRDRRVMFLLIIVPFLQLIIFGYAVNLEVDDVKTIVVDQDRTRESRSQLQALMADGTLKEFASTPVIAEAETQIVRGDAQAAIIIPEGYAKDFVRGQPTHIQALVDGSDPNRSLVASSAVSRYFAFKGLAATLSAQEARAYESGVAPRIPSITLVPRLLYNPGLDTAKFIVPGVAAILLMLITTIVAAMGLARERETGTLEQVLVTPIRPVVVVLGKITPFIVFGMFDFVLAMVLGAWMFDIPLRGNLFALGGVTLIYLMATLGTGVFISTISQNQQQALLGGVLFLLPAALLSGILTPVLAMPEWLQLATWVNPLRHYSDLIRAILLKGASVTSLWPQVLALTLFGVASIVISVRRFRKTLG